MSMIAVAHLRNGDVVRDDTVSFVLRRNPTRWSSNTMLLRFAFSGSRLAGIFLPNAAHNLTPGELEDGYRSLPPDHLVEVVNR